MFACLTGLSFSVFVFFFFFQAEDGIRDWSVTGVQTCALPICTLALEPDVIVLPDNSVCCFPLFLPDPPGMVMYHDNSGLTARVPLTLEEYLAGVHVLAQHYPQLALIQLDVKPQAAKQANGQKILDAIHKYLNYDDVMLN